MGWLSQQFTETKEKLVMLLEDIKENQNPKAYFWLLFFSLLYGIIHAIGPGHGKSLKVTREESKKLQMILDENLRANGIEYLLEQPIDITDYKKFAEELAKEGQHNPLDKAKAIIKANEEKNPALALELSELLERKHSKEIVALLVKTYA